ncbi:MAG: cyanophycin synthetase, partial [Chitinivibrionales bacterium]|nr:cyanophycin synthetase [Chitinivibrionales bacterium]
PCLSLITNIEADHLDCYRNLAEIEQTFATFTNAIPFYGAAVVCIDDPGVRRVLPTLRCSIITYGLDPAADYRAENIEFKNGLPGFVARRKETILAQVALSVPGLHNVRNALAAIAVACELGLPLETVAAAITAFSGVQRRFEISGQRRGVTVIDDYAHHPSEISATIAASKTSGFKRIIAVFQPHLYTRTRDFLEDFAESLMAADIAIVTDIYKAREEPIAGVSAEAIVDLLARRAHRHALYVADKKRLPETIVPLVREGDVVLCMGAGDIGACAKTILEAIAHE